MALTTDINFLSPLGYKFTMNRLPNVEYFIQSFDFPLVSLNETDDYQTPFGRVMTAGDHLKYDYFSFSFKIDEQMYSYFEIYDWLKAVGFPENWDQYAAIANTGPTSGKNVFSDADLIIMNGTMNPIIKVTFYDCLPVNLSSFKFSSTEDDVKYITASAEFKYRMFDYTRL